MLALDEGIDDERIPASLAERLALMVDVDTVPPRWAEDFFDPPYDAVEIAEARGRREQVTVSDETLVALCKVACVLGVDSLRAPILALAVARSCAALEGREVVSAEDAEWAVRWVLAPRATQVPAEDAAPPQDETPPPPEPEHQDAEQDGENSSEEVVPIDDLLVAAAVSALPPGLLASLAVRREQAQGPGTSGPSGALRRALLRGRPIGSRRGELREGKLNVIETLRAAAPWQRVRKAPSGAKVAIRTEDFRIRKHQQRAESLTVFCVDASGSSALQRLGEAKGAVERVLAECYSRRDTVALIGFRGVDASLLLPPTRSLVRAKRCLADLPGGGTTPLASGIDAALAVARDGVRRGQTPVIVVMTDGRANVRRDGTADRAGAAEDALQAARQVQAEGVRALFVDTAPRPRPVARALAEAMDARYLALPRTEADTLTRTIREPSDAR
ncbi:MAG: VWA domain-containing protein [Myxococcota bacterium]